MAYARERSDPELWARRQEWDRARYVKDIFKRRHSSLQTSDRNRGYTSSPWAEVKHLYDLPCYYCTGLGGGLDRIDNAQGHTVDNVRPCCYRCNNILSDLPDTAKQLLKPSLQACHESDAWGGWVPPTMRNR